MVPMTAPEQMPQSMQEKKKLKVIKKIVLNQAPKDEQNLDEIPTIGTVEVA
jgi:plasmid replication initiation protein